MDLGGCNLKYINYWNYFIVGVLGWFVLIGCHTNGGITNTAEREDAAEQRDIAERELDGGITNSVGQRLMTAEEVEKLIRKADCESWIKENVDKDFLIGNVRRKVNPLFVKVDEAPAEREIYLIRPVYEAFREMYEAALHDGVKLIIISGHRTYIEQVCEWELRWNNPRTEITFADNVEKAGFILQYRSMPGASRHHWGTDIDLNSFKLEYYESREGQQVYQWLKDHAATFGFYQPYTGYDENRRTGFQEEKWHWSYKPLSQPMLLKYIELVSLDDIRGFKGDAAVKKLPILSDWVCAINPQLKEDD